MLVLDIFIFSTSFYRLCSASTVLPEAICASNVFPSARSYVFHLLPTVLHCFSLFGIHVHVCI